MAYVEKSGSGYCVKKGNSGETLSCYRGGKAKSKATSEVSRLHKRNNPKAKNRGVSARKRNNKGKKK